MTEATAGAAPDFDRLPELDLAVESRLRPTIEARSTWGGERPPIGELMPEGDVRFLLVHHTASTNDYRPEDVIDQIRDFYDFHVGPERGWPDVAYNFLIDRFGGIWEARQGSIDGAVRGDATGGSQGFAQLASLIGNHVEAPPSPEAVDSLTRLLAWLAHRHRVDTGPGATVTFPSQGSNRWPQGVDVTARTVSGHRDMSETSCPGDSVYELLDQSIPERIQQLRNVALAEAAAELNVELDAPADGQSTDPGATADPTPVTIGSEAVAAGTDGVEAFNQSRSVEAAAPVSGADNDTGRYLVSAGATMVLGSVAGLIALRRRRIRV